MATDEQKCRDLRDALVAAQNRIQQVVPDLFRAREERQSVETRIHRLESQISQAETQQQVSRSATRVFGPGGAAVSALGSVEASIKLSRLEGEKSELESKLSMTDNRINALERERDAHEYTIANTPGELARAGCDSR